MTIHRRIAKYEEAAVLAPSAARLTVVQPDEPDRPMVPGFTASTRLASDATGSISIVEHVLAPGFLVPPHRHTLEDEISYVVEGEIGFRSNGREVSLAAGGYIVKPRDELHSMWNATDLPARMIEIITPAGFERYFADVAEAVAAAGRVGPDILDPIASRYGLVFDMADVRDLAARHGLRAPGADA